MKMIAHKGIKELTIEIDVPPGTLDVCVEFYSKRNEPIVKNSDRSPRMPGTAAAGAAASPAAAGAAGVAGAAGAAPGIGEIWFPVVDIALEPGLEGIVRLDPAASGRWGECAFNAAVKNEIVPASGSMVYPADRLVEWENTLYTTDPTVRLGSFALRKTVSLLPAITLKAWCRVGLLSDDWAGTIRAYAKGALLGSVQIAAAELAATQSAASEAAAPKAAPQADGSPGVGDSFVESVATAALERASAASVDYLLRSVNRAATSQTRGGFYLFYDLDAKTYRNAYWPWGWGPAIKFLLDAADAESLRGSSSAEKVRRVAVEAGETTLRFQIHNPWHIAHGLGTTRWSAKPAEKNGMAELVNSGSDAGFLVGWAWIPLYRATGDARYLEAAVRFSNATERLVERFGLIPQEYLPGQDGFTDFTIDESGFGTEGIAAVFEATGDEHYADFCRRYMEEHLSIFEREDGLWERRYNHGAKKIEQTEFMTRGLGWAMEGLLATHRASRNAQGGVAVRYLEKAEKMAGFMMRHQNADGSWSYQCTKTPEDVGVDEKGVALWSLLFYMLYAESGKAQHLTAARRALHWCLNEQYSGSDREAQGGIPGVSPQSGVIYRPWFRLSCTYTTGFFGLALLEELKIRRGLETRR